MSCEDSGRTAALTERAVRIGALLMARGWRLGSAESCTGGLVSDCITNVAGSSAFYVGGVVAYSNEVKHKLLDVSEELLANQGAVSAAAATAMAQGIRHVLNVQVGVAITGIAGPTGGTPQKPVGTVYVAVSSPLGDQVRHKLWTTDRLGNKRLSAEAALELLEEQLQAG